MAHEIDTTTGTAAMAWVAGSAKPWHGLGQAVQPDASVEEWRRAGGLAWDVLKAPVQFENEVRQELQVFNDRVVLYRSDTSQPMSVVSNDYKDFQPGDVLGFFKLLADTGGFSIETVGSLKGGRRIWALAKVGETAQIMDDAVAAYLMLATSYDGTMATIAKFTSVRVVCWNTMQAALTNDAGQRQVTVPHSTKFNADHVRQSLGIAKDSWELFQMKAGLMAARKMSDPEMDAYLQELLEPFIPYGQVYSADKVRGSKAYTRIVELFKGGQMGTGQDAIKDTLWGLVNATTQYLDHEKGRIQDNRLDNAWFGPGARIKDRAFELASKVVA